MKRPRPCSPSPSPSPDWLRYVFSEGPILVRLLDFLPFISQMALKRTCRRMMWMLSEKKIPLFPRFLALIEEGMRKMFPPREALRILYHCQEMGDMTLSGSFLLACLDGFHFTPHDLDAYVQEDSDLTVPQRSGIYGIVTSPELPARLVNDPGVVLDDITVGVWQGKVKISCNQYTKLSDPKYPARDVAIVQIHGRKIDVITCLCSPRDYIVRGFDLAFLRNGCEISSNGSGKVWVRHPESVLKRTTTLDMVEYCKRGPLSFSNTVLQKYALKRYCKYDERGYSIDILPLSLKDRLRDEKWARKVYDFVAHRHRVGFLRIPPSVAHAHQIIQVMYHTVRAQKRADGYYYAPHRIFDGVEAADDGWMDIHVLPSFYFDIGNWVPLEEKLPPIIKGGER